MQASFSTVLVSSLAVGAGGFFGALSRWGTALLFVRPDARFPTGTLVANLIGCLLIGVATGALQQRPEVSRFVALALVTGFLGAYTTFSTFSLDTPALAREVSVSMAVIYVVVSVGLGLTLVFVGSRVGGSL